MGKTFWISALSFVLGAGAGVAVGILVCKSKFEQKADDEIAAVKKTYEKYFAVGKSPKELAEEAEKQKIEPEEVAKDKPLIPEEKVIKGKDYSKMYKPGDDEEVKKIVGTSTTTVDDMVENREQRKKSIYLISPQSFRESPYECKSLLYYADGILADDDNNVIHTPSEVIGDEALNSFGRYESDCVYVRDDTLQLDYEVIKDTRRFEDVLAQANEHQDKR